MSEERVFECPEWFDGKKVNEFSFFTNFVRRFNMKVHNGRFYNPDGLVEDEDVKYRIAECLLAVCHDDLERRASWLLKSVRMFSSQIGWKPDPNLIHVRNGTLNVKTRLFDPKREVCLARLGVAFDPQAPAPARWLSFLEELLHPCDIPTLQEYMGYCLIPSTRAQRMLLILGSGGEGKSRIGVVLSHLLGDGCLRSSIHKVETNRFAPANLEGRLLMIDDDLNLNALPTTNTIKTIVTAETPIDLERKGVQSRQGIVNCRFLCFGNGALTSLYDHSDGFYRRQIVLHTRPRPRDRVDDPFLADKLIEELPGILLWCLEGLKRLQAQDYRFTISEATAMAMQQIRRESDNILEFMHSEGYLRFSHDARIPSSVLYRCYEDWCRDNSCRPFASNTFLARLREREDDFDIAYSTHIPYAGKRVRGFIGLCTADKPFGT